MQSDVSGFFNSIRSQYEWPSSFFYHNCNEMDMKKKVVKTSIFVGLMSKETVL